MNYKGIDKTKILEVQKVKLHNTDAYAVFTEAELKEICKGTDSFERLYKGIENQLKARMNDTEMAIICEMAMMYLDSLKVKEAADKETYNKGLNDAWELAKKILYGIDKQLIEIFDLKVEPRFFDLTHKRAIINDNAPQEALKRFEAYENEIKVGDVVKCKILRNEAVVTRLDTRNDGYITVIFKDGSGGAVRKDEYKKTGKHIDIQKILDELKKGNDNA